MPYELFPPRDSLQIDDRSEIRLNSDISRRDTPDSILRIIEMYRKDRSSLTAIPEDIQARYGYLPETAFAVGIGLNGYSRLIHAIGCNPASQHGFQQSAYLLLPPSGTNLCERVA
jgi:hypothetical protein